MMLLKLFLGFLRVGCFSFGGAYSAIPLIRDVVVSNGWLSDEVLSDMIAVSESTPGPIMVNMATYVGSSQAGLAGAAVATAAVVLPAFLIILIIVAALKNLIKNRWVQAVLGGLEPCIIGVILATGLFMIVKNLGLCAGRTFDWKALILTAVLGAFFFGGKYKMKKKISPILLIVIGAACGLAVYGI